MPSLETSLGVGDVVALKGSVNLDGMTGTASSIVCNDELEGFVLDVSALGIDGTGSLNVMGQTVTVTADTVFDSDTFASSLYSIFGIKSLVKLSMNSHLHKTNTIAVYCGS